jgi:hypothetical protein
MLAWRLAALSLLVFALGDRAMAVEEPAYRVSLQAGAFAVRDYAPVIVAEVSVKGDQDAAANAGFRLLAGYIFGGNVPPRRRDDTAPQSQPATAAAPGGGGRKIAMTAPVTQIERSGSWTVRFFMPRGSTLATLPAPVDPRVMLRALPAMRYAVVRFSGLAFAKDVARETAALEAFMAQHRLRAAGAPVLARYNPPWTLWFLRRNEVMIPLDAAPPALPTPAG